MLTQGALTETAVAAAVGGAALIAMPAADAVEGIESVDGAAGAEGARRRRRRGGRGRNRGEGASAEGAAGEGQTSDASLDGHGGDSAPATHDGGEDAPRQQRLRAVDAPESPESPESSYADESRSAAPFAAPFAAPVAAAVNAALPAVAESLPDAPAAQPAAPLAPLVAKAAPPIVVPASPSTLSTRAEPYRLPIDQLNAVASSAGLEWVHSDGDKVRAAQQAMADEVLPPHVPRPPKPPVAIDDGPLVLVETKKDLSQIRLPFDNNNNNNSAA